MLLLESRANPFRVWIDIENPPQVQYLLPFRQAFEAAGLETVITARDYGSTVRTLESAGVPAKVYGVRVGRGRLRKAAATAHRAYDLQSFLTQTGKPGAVLTASRSAAIAAWRLGIPSFVILDYEHVFVRVCRYTDSTVIFPDVIDPAAFVRKGLRPRQLLPVKGIKEDLTFAGVDLDTIDPYDIGSMADGTVRVLFRPPSETSHYYREASTAMARTALERLANAEALVVFSPREPSQVALLDGLPWKHQPVTLSRSVPFVPLLKSVDAVVCSGGTMLREAAYLGIPAYSILQSEIGAVDRWLETIGRAKLIAGPEDVCSIELRRRGPIRRLDSNPDLLDQIAATVVARARKRHRVPAGVV